MVRKPFELELLAGLPNARRVEIAECGHYPVYTHPARLAAEGKTALLLVWDKASWHVSQAVRAWPPAATDVVACDVGQGDALVVPTGPAAGLLIDAGPDVAAVDRCLDRLGIESLPLILLSVHGPAEYDEALTYASRASCQGKVGVRPFQSE